jgi:hypothetical protein
MESLALSRRAFSERAQERDPFSCRVVHFLAAPPRRAREEQARGSGPYVSHHGLTWLEAEIRPEMPR